jgi:hypothetical protein
MVDQEDYRLFEAGETKLAIGRAQITSEITQESDRLNFGVLYFGDHNLAGGISAVADDEDYEILKAEIGEAFQRADLPDIIRQLDKHFSGSIYSLQSLFRDEQRHIIDMILKAMQDEVETAYRQIYDHHAPLMRFLVDLNIPIPKGLRTVLEAAMNMELRRLFQEETLNADRVRTLFEETENWRLELDAEGIAYSAEQMLTRLAERFRSDPANIELLKRLEAAATVVPTLPFNVSLWKPQNSYFEVLRTDYPFYRGRAEQGDEAAREWVEHFAKLGDAFSIRVE